MTTVSREGQQGYSDDMGSRIITQQRPTIGIRFWLSSPAFEPGIDLNDDTDYEEIDGSDNRILSISIKRGGQDISLPVSI